MIYFSLNGKKKKILFPDPKDAITFLEKTKEKVSWQVPTWQVL